MTHLAFLVVLALTVLSVIPIAIGSLVFVLAKALGFT